MVMDPLSDDLHFRFPYRGLIPVGSSWGTSYHWFHGIVTVIVSLNFVGVNFVVEPGPSYVGNVFVQNVTGLRKYVATQDMSDMSQTCHMTFFFNVARHLRKSTLINVAKMSSKRHVFEMSS